MSKNSQPNLDRIITNVQDFLNWISQFKEKICVSYSSVKYTYETLLTDINSKIEFLIEQHVVKGDYVGLFIDSNTYQYITWVLALLSLECVVVPIETSFIHSVNNFFNNFKFKLVLTDAIYNIAFEKYKEDIQTVSRIDISSLNITQLSKLTYKNIECSAESPALVLFSTGSTGIPKIVLIPQKTIFFFGRPDHTIWKYKSIWNDASTFMTCCPLKTSVNFLYNIIFPLIFGWRILLYSTAALGNLTEFEKLIIKNQPHVMFSPPVLLDIVYKANHNIKFLKALPCGGSELKLEQIKRFQSDGVEIWNGYGMVETNTVLICNPSMPEQYTGAIGTPSRNDIKFKISFRKRLLIKHDSLLLGYIKNGKLRKATDRNGYFHTNDKVCIKDGIYFFLGRIKKRKSIRNKSWKNL